MVGAAATHVAWFDGGINPCITGGEQCCAGLCSGPCSDCKTCNLPCSHCKTCCDATCDCNLSCTATPAPLNASVPNVLLVGDSISGVGTGYLTNVQDMLGPSASTSKGGGPVGNAFVQSGPSYGKNFCGTSYGMIDCTKIWADHSYNTGWDVIHFNWGLHDLRMGGQDASNGASADPAKNQIDVETYGKNLHAIIDIFEKEAPGAKLVMGSTTPVPGNPGTVNQDGSTHRIAADVPIYNAVRCRLQPLQF